MKTDTSSYPWTDTLPLALINSDKQVKKTSTLFSDSDFGADTISLDSNTTEDSCSTKLKKKTRATKSTKEDQPDAYICSSCQYCNVAWFEFETHCKVMHKLNVQFPCTIPDCYKFYTSKNGLKSHCTRLHKDVLTCSKCHHMATSLQTLQEHTLSHRDKKFSCPSCRRGFGTKWDVNRHFVKCLENPQCKITCKQCSVNSKSVDISGAEEG